MTHRKKFLFLISIGSTTRLYYKLLVQKCVYGNHCVCNFEVVCACLQKYLRKNADLKRRPFRKNIYSTHLYFGQVVIR